MNSSTKVSTKLAPIADSEGTFAMLALDQRESLRAMLAGNGDATLVSNRDIVDFKTLAKVALTPHATAVLLDRQFGLVPNKPKDVADGCALILAADVLHQTAGQPVSDTDFDDSITVEVVEETGAAALKLLIMWKADEPTSSRQRIVDKFLERCAEANVAAVVEGIVVPPLGGFGPGEKDDAVLAAAKELSTDADLYKAQVPGYTPGDVSGVRRMAERLSASISAPWVVLSNGVRAVDFAGGVEQACLGGASGFLAGRAIWADTVTDLHPQTSLEVRSTQRLNDLNEIVKAATSDKDHGAGT